jgi:hypothetical protein
MEYLIDITVDREISIDLFADFTYSPKLITQTIIKYLDRPLMKSETFIATAGQTVFAPADFSPDEYSRVYLGGYRTTMGLTISGGVVTFDTGVAEGSVIVIDQN